MESNPNTKNIVEELKAAGEELKKVERGKVLKFEESKDSEVSREKESSDQNPVEKSASAEPQKPAESSPPGWVSFQLYQKEIDNERQKLEKTYKEVEDWQRKIQERLGLIKELADQNEKINKELEKFQQKIVLIRKENDTFLFQIKNKTDLSTNSGS